MGFATMGALSSCDVHQWPEPNNEPVPNPEPEPGPNPSATSIVKLDLKYLTDFDYRHHDYDMKSGVVGTGVAGDNYDNIDNLMPGTPMKVTVKVHLNNVNQTQVLSQSFIKNLDTDFDTDVEIEVPSGQEYLITVWGHLLDSKEESFYDDTDFNAIKLINAKYDGNNDMRDAFRGRLKVSVSDEEYLQGTVEMRRPMGKFELVATDLQAFLANEEKRVGLGTRAASLNDYTIVISYPAYYPNSYTAMDNRNENSGTGYSFSTKFSSSLDMDKDEETSLGFDYVFINDTSDTGVQVQLTVNHADGTKVASTGMITIPMQRDVHVVLRGDFLSTYGDGGIGIDPDFDGDFNVPIH